MHPWRYKGRNLGMIIARQIEAWARAYAWMLLRGHVVARLQYFM
jgi:hypothetical protein